MRTLLAAFAALCLLFTIPAPAYAADNDRTTGEQIADAASDAWKALKNGARDAWNATVKAFDSLVEGTKEIVLPAALPGSLSGKQLIGTSGENVQQKERVVGPNGQEVATVHDILLSPVGEARYAILSVKGPSAKLVSVMVSSLTFTRGGEPLRTSLTAEQL